MPTTIKNYLMCHLLVTAPRGTSAVMVRHWRLVLSYSALHQAHPISSRSFHFPSIYCFFCNLAAFPMWQKYWDFLICLDFNKYGSAFAVCYVYNDSSLLLFETYANVSSQICPFLALRPEFHSNHCVNWSTPRYCQSATFGRLTFCVYTLLFYGIRV